MNCPKCLTPLTIGERNNVEIDYCQTCRGIWLDAGELDKILDRSLSRRQSAENALDRDQRNGRNSRDDNNESWWERILDIID